MDNAVIGRSPAKPLGLVTDWAEFRCSSLVIFLVWLVRINPHFNFFCVIGASPYQFDPEENQKFSRSV